MKEFFKYHFLKVLVGIIVLQFIFFYWLENRNHRPVAIVDEVTVFEGQTVQCKPLANDTDEDEDEITLQDVSAPAYGKITIKDEALTYMAIKGFVGVDSFTYIINDSSKTAESYIKVTVKENLKPIAKDDKVESYPTDTIRITVLDNDHDREGDSIFISEFTEPAQGKIMQQGDQLIYLPGKNPGNDSFSYDVSDGFSLSGKATVTINFKDKNDPCYPWLSADIGNTSKSGAFYRNEKIYTLSGSGNDIWGSSDGCHFAYQLFSGDFEIVAKLKSIDNTNAWAKAGLMAREDLNGNSKNIFICITPENGSSFQWRAETGGETSSSRQPDEIKAPYWIKLSRKGNTFTGYTSQNGKNWTETGNQPVNINKNIYIGMVVSGHDNEKLCKSGFEIKYIK